MQNKNFITGLILFSLAAAVRGIFLFVATDLSLIGDQWNYWYAAKRMADGTYYGTKFLPLWPWFMSILVGFYPKLLGVRLLVALISSINVAFIYFVGKKAFNARIGILAAVIMAFYPESVFYSHSLYAEPLWEMLLLLATWLFLRIVGDKGAQKWLWLPFLVLGVALTCKQFALVSYLAFIVALLWVKAKPLKKYTAVALLVFFIPISLYSGLTYLRERNAFPLTESISINVFGRGGFLSGKKKKENFSLTRELTSLTSQRNIKRTGRIFFNVWSSSSYSVMRFLEPNYYRLPGKWFFVSSAMTYHVVLMVLGLVGLCSAPHNLYHKLSISTLVLFSLLTVGMFIVTRHRYPYMFIFAVYAAFSLLRFDNIAFRLRSPWRWGVLTVLLLILMYSTISRLPHMGNWL